MVQFMSLQGGKAGAAPPAAPAYDADEFKRDLATSVQPILADTVDQMQTVVQSAEQDIARCLEVQLTQAQQAAANADKSETVAKLWDLFALLRSQSRLTLPGDNSNPISV